MEIINTQLNLEQQVINLYNDGIGTSSIQKQLSIPYQRIRKILIKNNIIFRTHNDYFNLRYPQELRDRIINLNLEHNKSPFEISKIMNLDEGVINRVFRKNNIKPIRYKNNKRLDLTIEEKNAIIKSFSDTNSMIRTARNLNVSEAYVVKILKEFNLYKPTEYFQYNSSYFDSINTHEKAYILGLLITDGHNSTKRGMVSLVLKRDDENLVKRINLELTINKPLFYPRMKNNIYCGFRIHNIFMSRRLEQLGLPDNKTFKIKPEEWMMGEFSNSTILGMFDGDGSIYCKNVKHKTNSESRKDWVFSFIGLKCICDMMNNIFLNQLGITSCVTPHSRYKNNLEKPIYTIRVYGNRQVRILFDWLYKDSKIRMDRKYKRYLELCNPTSTRLVNQFG